MPGRPFVKIHMFEFEATRIFFSYPMHDGIHFFAVHSGDRKKLDKDQILVFGD